MNNDGKAICKEFQAEIFLYLSDELSIERRMFWKKHLLTCSDCKSEMETLIKISDALKEEAIDVGNLSFDKMIETATAKRGWLQYFLKNRHNYDEKKSFYGKAALAGALATAAIIVSIITHQSIPVKNIPNNILDWEDTQVVSQIDDIKTRIQMIDDDKWDKEIYLLGQRVKKLEKKSDKFSFN